MNLQIGVIHYVNSTFRWLHFDRRFFKHMEELSKKEELEKRLINQSININNSILSTQIKRKWCYFCAF